MALKDVPQSFNIDSEDEVRFAIAQYFIDLGFGLDELSFEDHFTILLGRNRFVTKNSYRNGDSIVERAVGFSDLLLTRNGTPLAIVEVKQIDHKLTDEDAEQAISYARLLRRIAPYAIVTNGIDTKIYDPLSDSDELIEISDPRNSRWAANGQTLQPLGDDLRYAAARKLVGINAVTLLHFCRSQLDSNLEELEGTIYQNKIYVPELYLPRQSLETAFTAWTHSDLTTFAVIGESGVGKSNFMCAKARELAHHNFVLFYPARYLSRGLRGAIESDFIWEFRRQANIAQLVDRLDEIVSRHGNNLIIFIDGLDEYPGDQEQLKAELRDFAFHISDTSLKLCVSCKLYDWTRYVIDDGQIYNRFAKSVFPAKDIVHKPEEQKEPDARNVGVILSRYSSAELDAAFQKYKTKFSLEGSLQEETRSECELPLMLRLLAEVYSGKPELPDQLSSRELFEKYWNRKLDRVTKRLTSELILSTLARILVEGDHRQASVRVLSQEAGIRDVDTGSFQDSVV